MHNDIYVITTRISEFLSQIWQFTSVATWTVQVILASSYNYSGSLTTVGHDWRVAFAVDWDFLKGMKRPTRHSYATVTMVIPPRLYKYELMLYSKAIKAMTYQDGLTPDNYRDNTENYDTRWNGLYVLPIVKTLTSWFGHLERYMWWKKHQPELPAESHH